MKKICQNFQNSFSRVPPHFFLHTSWKTHFSLSLSLSLSPCVCVFLSFSTFRVRGVLVFSATNTIARARDTHTDRQIERETHIYIERER